MTFNLFPGKKYLHCRELQSGIHFFHNEIRACCSNVTGPVFYPDYKGEKPLDWDYIYNERKKYIKEFNSFFSKKHCPKVCQNCFENEFCLENAKVMPFENLIDKVFFQNNMSCNAKCVYCVFKDYENSYNYKVVPIVKDMIQKGILSKNADIYMSGGEITVSPEFEELMYLLTDYCDSAVEIFTSGIKYCKSIEDAFVKNKVRLVISLDSATRETYLKIKQVDCFDKIVSNLKSYINASQNAKKNITLKYILLDDFNDNEEEIKGFISLVKSLGIENVRIDLNFEKYSCNNDVKVPEHYYGLIDLFKNSAINEGLNIQTNDQVTAVLNK